MVKDHSDRERGNLLPPHGLLFPISSKITHTTAFVTPVVEHWLEREIFQWVHHEGSIRRHITPWANTLTMELHITPWNVMRSIKCDYLIVDINIFILQELENKLKENEETLNAASEQNKVVSKVLRGLQSKVCTEYMYFGQLVISTHKKEDFVLYEYQPAWCSMYLYIKAIPNNAVLVDTWCLLFHTVTQPVFPHNLVTIDSFLLLQCLCQDVFEIAVTYLGHPWFALI